MHIQLYPLQVIVQGDSIFFATSTLLLTWDRLLLVNSHPADAG